MVAETLLSLHVNIWELGRKHPTKGAPVRHLRSCELVMYKKRWTERSLFSLETRRPRRPNSCLPPSKGGLYRRQSQTSLRCTTEAREVIGKSCNRGIWVGYKAKLFTLRAIKYRDRVQQGCGVSILENFQNSTTQGIWATWSNHVVSCALGKRLTRWHPEIPPKLNLSMIL